MRGLKREKLCKSVCSMMSHPAWVRGLKPHVQMMKKQTKEVAPCVGAWIETKFESFKEAVKSGRTLRGCVD